MRRAITIAFVLVLVVGCQIDTPSTGAVPQTSIDPVEPGAVIAPEPTPAAVVSCSPDQLAFFGGPQGWTGGEHRLKISPNGAVAARWSTHGFDDRAFIKLTDGETLMKMPWDWPGALDAGWHVRARPSEAGGIVVATALTGSKMLEVSAGPPPSAGQGDPWQHRTVPQLSNSGDRLVSVDCWSRGYKDTFEEHATLSVWSLPSGTLERKVELEVGCEEWAFEPRLVLNDAATIAVVAGDHTILSAVDLSTGELMTAEIPSAETEEVFFPYVRPIVDVALSADGTLIAVVDDSETLRILDRATMTLLSSAPAAIFPIDADSYMPTFGTPLSFSPDGNRIAVGAWHQENPALVVLDLSTGEAGAPLLLPEEHNSQNQGFNLNAPVEVQFLPDGSGLVTSYDVGLALWRCPGQGWDAPSEELKVALELPPPSKVGQPVTFTATHFGSDAIHSHQFFVNGEAVADPAIEREVEWTPLSAGDYEVMVVVDNGLNVGSTTAILAVTHP